MAPNVPIHIQRDSEETSIENVQIPLFDLGLQSNQQFFQNPDSPNQHQLPQAPVRPVNRSFQPSRTPAVISASSSLKPRTDGALVEANVNNRSNRRFNGNIPPTKDVRVSPSVRVSTLLPPSIPTANRNPSSNRPTVSQVPATLIPGRVPSGGIQQSTKDIPEVDSIPEVDGSSVASTTTTTQVLRSTQPPTTAETPRAQQTTTSKPTTHSHVDFGVLKLPGHEPEAPADLNLVHHDRAIDTHNQTGQDGILIKDDPNFLTPEGATALILIGLCSVFLVFICFIMFVQKIRRQRIDKKVVQDDDNLKSQQPRYEATSTTYHPNPLSFLPPEILHALMQPAVANKIEEQPHAEPMPSFLTMEPPQPGNQLGRLWFSVHYDYMKATLVIHILHARYVKGRGSSTNPGNVWVEACVLTPMNTIKASNKTDTRRASLAPVFNQSFRFQVADEEVTQFLLRLTLYDNHPQNGEKAVGSVIVPLSTVDLCSSDTISRDLQ